MTIFLMVLKKLIKEQLDPAITNLTSQIASSRFNYKTYLYDQKLAKAQLELVHELDNAIVMFEGSNDDKADCVSIAKIVDEAVKANHQIRRAHAAAKAHSNTMTSLADLRLHITDFYDKLNTFPFKLLDLQYTDTPENIINYYAACYFGEEIFFPMSGIDLNIRAEKEQKLATRLEMLRSFNFTLERFLAESKKSSSAGFKKSCFG